MPIHETITENGTTIVNSWASIAEPDALRQAARTGRLPIVAGPVALMPDTHVGIGATIGSVIPTEGAVIPAAVGVDLGCGVSSVRFDMTADQLPDDLDAFMPFVEQAIPAGVGKGHDDYSGGTNVEKAIGRNETVVDRGLQSLAIRQCGTLGSGNHFGEVCLDENDRVWIMLHSGSRGVGNKLASLHITGAKNMMKHLGETLEDPDLAYLVQGTPEFDAYIRDMLWAQDYARLNREVMLDAVVKAFTKFMAPHGITPVEVDRISCHHNFTEQEVHDGRTLWITRKGAIRANVGDRGIIPGSMGTRSYVVEGLGNPLSYNSCSHGAGRRMSRGQAKRTLDVTSLETAMAGRTWNRDKAAALLDEHPDAYKDIDVVMADSTDLVNVVHELRAVLNYKGA